MCIRFKDKETIYAAVLKDKTSVTFHFVGPECKECISMGLKNLSIKTRCYRFNTPINEFSKNQLHYLTNIDNKNHLALGCDADNINDPGAGIARYIKTSDNPSKAEIAITVVDEFQSRGAGTLLLCMLIKYACKNNIDIFYGYSKNNNKPIYNILKKFKDVIYKNSYDLKYLEFNIKENYETAIKILNAYQNNKINLSS